MKLDQDMRAVIQAAHLCFAATVTSDHRPNLSPKGTIRVWDEDHLFFLDIASRRSRSAARVQNSILVGVEEFPADLPAGLDAVA